MNHPKMKFTYVGVDSHKDTHYAVVLNCFFEKLGEVEFPNEPSKFPQIMNRLEKFKVEGTSLLFGLEDISAYGRNLALFLMSKKHGVKHVNALLVAHERKSSSVLHKTDSFDAECASRVLLNRFDSLPNAEPQDKYFVLSQLVTRRNSIVKINAGLKNHLHALLTTNYPIYTTFFHRISSKTAMRFFENYPSPSILEGVTVEGLSGFLKDITPNRNWEKTATKILHSINSNMIAQDYQGITNMAILSSIRQIKSNNAELDVVEGLIEDFLDNFEYKLMSIKGIDIVSCANLIAEIGDIERFSTSSKLARFSGVAPVTYSSGKSNIQFANERGNKVLKRIIYTIAVNLIGTPKKRIINPFFYEYYHKKISEGKTKKQALKCVQRRLVNIIWSMMKHKTEYINPPTMSLNASNQSDKIGVAT